MLPLADGVTMTDFLGRLASLQPGGTSAACSAILGGVGLIVMFARRQRLRGTTLVAPWYWALFSLLAVASCEALAGSVDSSGRDWINPLRWGAAATTFCPSMARLGAKRPQDRAWQLIVLSLWIILALPAWEGLVVGSGQVHVSGVRAGFLVVLIAVSLLDALPTRYWLSALLAAAGQLCLVGRYLPIVALSGGTAAAICGLGLIVAAMSLTVAGLPLGRAPARWEDRVWLDFRDAFGALWALRVAQRVNTSASMYGWNIFLGWNGLRVAGGPKGSVVIAPHVERALHQSLRAVLRRFVSAEWIDLRLGGAQA